MNTPEWLNPGLYGAAALAMVGFSGWQMGDRRYGQSNGGLTSPSDNPADDVPR